MSWNISIRVTDPAGDLIAEEPDFVPHYIQAGVDYLARHFPDHSPHELEKALIAQRTLSATVLGPHGPRVVTAVIDQDFASEAGPQAN